MAITGAQILSVLRSRGAGTGLVASADQLAAGADRAMRTAGIKTLNAAAAFMATMAQESAYFRTTTEYGSGQSYAPYIGRTFQQVTGNDNIRGYNYAAFGTWAKSKGHVTDAGIFVKNPTLLAGMTYAWLGGVWYWTTPRNWGEYRNLVEVADTGSILMVSRAVNAGNPFWSDTPNGMDERTALYTAFRALGNSIIPGTSTPTTPTTTVPAGYIPGTKEQVVNAATAVWNADKNKYYGNAWPRLRELGVPNQPWCAHAVRYFIRKATSYDIVRWCPGYAWTPTFARKCKADPLWQEVTYANARAGDVVFFFKTAAKAATLDCYHVGQVVAGPTSAGHDMQTIEGNTSTPGLSTSMSSGGTVAKKTRSDLDTGYYRMRIWRPPYMTVTTTPTEPPPTTPVEDDTDTVVERPVVPQINPPSALLTQNPIDLLRVSPAFVASMESSGRVTSRVTAWYDGRQEGPAELPLLADSSTVKVSSGSPVRRVASLVFQEDMTDAELNNIYNLLATPGIQLKVETGHGWGGDSEMVPVHYGECRKPVLEWPDRRITVESKDLMLRVAEDYFGGVVNTSPDMTMVETVAFFATEHVARSRMVDLTGAPDMMLAVTYQDEPETRVNAAMELATALGAEFFASPVPDMFVLRPVASLMDQPRWFVEGGQNLISLSRTTDWDNVGNLWVVVSEQADQPRVKGEYRITDETHPLRWGGPFGCKTRKWPTSLLTDREQCETAAKALCDRYIGGRVTIDWTMLRNPLMEAGDRVQVATDKDTYQVVVDSFEVPLGNQRVTPATARSLSTEGIS